MSIELTGTTNVALTKKEAKALKKQQEKIKEANAKAEAEKLYMALIGQSDATTSKGVRKDVRSDIKDLKGYIDEEVYDQAIKMTRNTWLRQLFGKKKDSQALFQAEARGNKRDAARAGEYDFSKKSQALLEKANLTTNDLNAIVDRNIGSDNFVNYSYKKRQVGELDAIVAEFNQNTGGVKFTKKQVKNILEDMGVDVEKMVRPGKVVKDAAIGAAVAGPLGFVKMTQNQNSANSLVNAKQSQTLKIAGAAPIVGGAIGAAHGVAKEIYRVEARVASKILPQNVNTYEEYAKYVESDCTKKGADIMKKISKFYDFENGFDKKGLEAALHDAAGEGSVLNYEEALKLYQKLVTGEIEPKQPKAKEPEKAPETRVVKETCEISTGTESKENIVPVESKCHTVQLGDTWYELARAKYGATGNDLKVIVAELKEAYYEANKEELNKKGINSPKGAFFPAVGEELCLPENIKGYKYNESAKAKTVTPDENYNGATISNTSNPFTKKETKTVHIATTCDGTRIEADSKEALDEKIKKYKEQNPDKEVVVR